MNWSYNNCKVYAKEFKEIPRRIFTRVSQKRLNTVLQEDWQQFRDYAETIDKLYPPRWGYDATGIFIECADYSLFFHDCFPSMYGLYHNLPDGNFFKNRLIRLLREYGKTPDDLEPVLLKDGLT